MLKDLNLKSDFKVESEIIKRKNILRTENIEKSFPGVNALKGINLEFKSGEIHAIVGENGAGKSTFIKILSGVYLKDSGNIYINDESVDISNPRVANSLGISVVHQEFSLIPELDIAHNIFLGMEPLNLKGFKLNKNLMHKKAREVLKNLNLEIDTKIPVYQLSVPEQQSIEIAKALIRDAWLFIMDEPTSALTDNEKKFLFKIIKKLAAEGAAVIYISHHLEEIFEISEKISIFRDGNLVGIYNSKDLSEHEVANLMVGKEVNILFSRSRVNPGKKVLEISGLSKRGSFENISFEVHQGEVLGLSGLLGSGRSELCRAIYGLDRYDKGFIKLDEKTIRFKSSLDAIKSGVLYSPSDRRKEGIIPLMPIGENLTLNSLFWMSSLGWINNKTQKNISSNLIDKLDIKALSLLQKVLNLSGGNQQKVLIGKCLAKRPKVLILDDPTRGIDVGAKEEIYKIIENLASEKVAIIIISPELQELTGLSDRIITFLNGKTVKEYKYPNFNVSEILEDILIETNNVTEG